MGKKFIYPKKCQPEKKEDWFPNEIVFSSQMTALLSVPPHHTPLSIILGVFDRVNGGGWYSVLKLSSDWLSPVPFLYSPLGLGHVFFDHVFFDNVFFDNVFFDLPEIPTSLPGPLPAPQSGASSSEGRSRLSKEGTTLCIREKRGQYHSLTWWFMFWEVLQAIPGWRRTTPCYFCLLGAHG